MKRPNKLHLYKTIMITLLGVVMLSACDSRVERNYKIICKGMGGEKKFCSCTYDHLEKRYGVKTLTQIFNGQRQKPSDYDETLGRFAQMCMSEH